MQSKTDSLDAYDHYLRGMTNLHRGTRESIDEALARFDRALQLDPNFASAHAMAAWCYFWRKVNGWMTDRPREIAEGARLARRASSWAGTMRSHSRAAVMHSATSPATSTAASP